MKARNWLRIAEYLSLVAAVVGSVVSEVSRQLIFTSAPLSLSLFLGLLNRRREHQELSQNTTTDLKQISQDFFWLNQQTTRDLDALRKQLLTLPTPPEHLELTHLKGAVKAVQVELETRLAPLEALNLESIQTAITQLQTEIRTTLQRLDQKDEVSTPEQNFEKLTTSIQSLYQRQITLEQAVIKAVQTEMQTRLDPLTTVNPQTIYEGITQLHTEMNQLKDQVQSLNEQPLNILPNLQAQVSNLQQQMETNRPNLEIQALEEQLETVKTTILRLEQQLAQPNTKHDLKLITAAIKHLYQRQTTLERSLHPKTSTPHTP